MNLRKLFTSLLAAMFVLAVGMISLGCPGSSSTTGPPGGGGGLTATPGSVTVQTGQQATSTISGGTQPYSIQTQPNSSVATASINGTTLTVDGIGAGSTSVTVRDSSAANTVAVPITVVTAGGFGSGSISATVTPGIGNMSFSGPGIWPPSGSGTVAIYDTVQTYLSIIGYNQISGSVFRFLIVGLYAGPGGIQTGTFPVNDTVGTGFIVGADIDTNSVDTLGYFSFTGSISVSAASESTVVGSFSGSAVRPQDGDMVSVNGGSFNVLYVRGRNPLEAPNEGGPASLITLSHNRSRGERLSGNR